MTATKLSLLPASTARAVKHRRNTSIGEYILAVTAIYHAFSIIYISYTDYEICLHVTSIYLLFNYYYYIIVNLVNCRRFIKGVSD